MKIFVFGNGNLSFEDFIKLYANPIKQLINENTFFILCDFKGVDTLMMEFLKCKTPNVSVYHIGSQPRYSPDKYKTNVMDWKFISNFSSDKERDLAAIEDCTHFLAYDFNTDVSRKSGTSKSIEKCLFKGKINLSKSIIS